MHKRNEGTKQAYCYILEAGPFLKIGYTDSLDGRIQELQTGCPFELSVLCLFTYQTIHAAREMELSLHLRFRRFNVRGEWFRKKPVLKHLKNSGDL